MTRTESRCLRVLAHFLQGISSPPLTLRSSPLDHAVAADLLDNPEYCLGYQTAAEKARSCIAFLLDPNVSESEKARVALQYRPEMGPDTCNATVNSSELEALRAAAMAPASNPPQKELSQKQLPVKPRPIAIGDRVVVAQHFNGDTRRLCIAEVAKANRWRFMIRMGRTERWFYQGSGESAERKTNYRMRNVVATRIDS